VNGPDQDRAQPEPVPAGRGPRTRHRGPVAATAVALRGHSPLLRRGDVVESVVLLLVSAIGAAGIALLLLGAPAAGDRAAARMVATARALELVPATTTVVRPPPTAGAGHSGETTDSVRIAYSWNGVERIRVAGEAAAEHWFVTGPDPAERLLRIDDRTGEPVRAPASAERARLASAAFRAFWVATVAALVGGVRRAVTRGCIALRTDGWQEEFDRWARGSRRERPEL